MNDAQTIDRIELSHFGPLVRDHETLFRLWAPSAYAPMVKIEGRQPVPMSLGGDGFHIATVEGAGQGTHYRFRVGDLEFPDLASRQQDGDTDGWSIVREPLRPSDRQAPLRPWHETVHLRGPCRHRHARRDIRRPHEPARALPRCRLHRARDHAGQRIPGLPQLGLRRHADLCARRELRHARGAPRARRPRARARPLHDPRCRLQPLRRGRQFRRATMRPSGSTKASRRPGARGSISTSRWSGSSTTRTRACGSTEYDFDGLRFDAIHEIKTRSRDRFLGELAETAKR